MAASHTVLFVEDEPAMRELVRHILSAKGFTVLLAKDGYEATGILAERAVDLMLTDIVMPGISGFELAMQAKLMHPGLKVLYTTGYSEQAKGGGIRYGKLLSKPLRPAELVWEINQALAGSLP